MTFFTYREGQLWAEDVPVRDIAAEHGTPLYLYSRAALESAYNAYVDALQGRDALVCYAVKANSNLAVLNLLARLGAGFDIVSVGELERVVRAGGDPGKTVFSGVGKKPAEIARALELGILCINLESAAELEAVERVAAELGCTAPVSVRVNPDVDARTHPYISTGLKQNKFGVEPEQALRMYEAAANSPHLEVVGMDCHIGSQLTTLAPFRDALRHLLTLVDTLAGRGISIRHLDVGGGLGVTYRDETPPPIADFVAAICEQTGDRELTLLFEPGRSIAARAGVLITTVDYLKPAGDHNFALVDAAMNDMIRPALYQAWLDIQPVTPHTGSEVEARKWDIVGPVCETADFLGKERSLALLPGDLLAIFGAGAYGFTMSSNYNTRCRPPEVLVDGDRVHLARPRERLEDIMAQERCLPE